MGSQSLERRGRLAPSYKSSMKLRYVLRYKLHLLSSLSPLQRTATNTELCNELSAHIQGLHDQLLRPLVGKTEGDIPDDTRAALGDYTQYVGVVSFGNGV